MKKSLVFGICFGLLFIGMLNFVSAKVYFSEGEDLNPSFNVAPSWLSTLSTQDGKFTNISFMKVKWTIPGNISQRDIFVYINDGENEYLQSALFKEDVSLESHVWGCLKGASFTEKFISFFKIIFGGKPYSITETEEQEFEKEGWAITNTPGTGAFNAKKCSDLCNENSAQKARCDLSSRCPIPLDEIVEQRNCYEKCVGDSNCGEVIQCNTDASDGLCGVKEMTLETKGKDYNVKLNINPADGKIVLDGSSINGQKIKVIREEGNFYSFRDISGL